VAPSAQEAESHVAAANGSLHTAAARVEELTAGLQASGRPRVSLACVRPAAPRSSGRSRAVTPALLVQLEGRFLLLFLFSCEVRRDRQT
jgi:hypothetical protein